MSDDPFAEPTDTDRTVMRRSMPAGRVPAPQPMPVRQTPPATTPQTGSGRLAAAARPLLAAAVGVASTCGQGPDVEQLHRAMVQGVRDFEKQAQSTELDTRSLRAARYALCATIDDLVLSAPWGTAGNWHRRSLVSIFHNGASGGERFYDILEQMLKDLGQHAEAVELMYLCMALGFQGRYRALPGGAPALTELRDGVFRTLSARHGAFQRALSPHWQGQATIRPRRGPHIPLGAACLGAAGLALVIYSALNLALAGASDVAFAALSGLPPQGAVIIPRVAAADPPPQAPARPATMALVARLHQFLAPEIKARLVTVLADQQAVTVRLSNRGMFAGGQAALNAAFKPMLWRLGAAIGGGDGAVMVNGYTDNQPIRTVRFPSNFDLSQGQADAVGRLISARLSDPKRVHATGQADADPIASNATAEGRQQNRRTEVVLVQAGSN